MLRKIDELGRLVIPKEMRKEIGLDNGDDAEINIDGNKIIITNPKKIDIEKYILHEMREYEYNSREWLALNNILQKIRKNK